MTSLDADDGDRRGRLLAMKLRALVRGHVDHEPGEARGFPPGAALLTSTQGWVLVDDAAGPRLGAAIAWARRAGATELHVIAEADAGTIARRATGFAWPIRVWTVDGTTLRSAVPEALPSPPAARDEHLALRELIAAGGAVPAIEHGVVFGEVHGLEVCRVVDDPVLGDVRLEVGVGVHDREAFQVMHGDVPTVDSLARVVDAVAARRRPGADRHPLNRIGQERLLRWRLEQDPGLVGATMLAPAPPPVPRRNVKDPVPCVAAGTDVDGRPVTVVCSVGVDLEVVPYAVDARLAASVDDGTERRLVIAVPGRDRVPVLDELVGLVTQPAGWSSVEVASID